MTTGRINQVSLVESWTSRPPWSLVMHTTHDVQTQWPTLHEQLPTPTQQSWVPWLKHAGYSFYITHKAFTSFQQGWHDISITRDTPWSFALFTW